MITIANMCCVFIHNTAESTLHELTHLVFTTSHEAVIYPFYRWGN